MAAERFAKRLVVWKSRRLGRGKVELDEPLPLYFGDVQSSRTSMRWVNPPMLRVNSSGPPNDSESKALSCSRCSGRPAPNSGCRNVSASTLLEKTSMKWRMASCPPRAQRALIMITSLRRPG